MATEEKKKFITIRYAFEHYFNEHNLLDNENCQVFKMQLNGQCYAANKKTKKPARVTISLPSDLGNTESLQFIDKWLFIVVAIPRDEFKNEIEEINKEKEVKEK